MSETVIRPTDLMGNAILDAREERVELQTELLKQYGMPLLVHRVNMPGGQKDTALSQGIFKAVEAALMILFNDRVVYKKQLLTAEGPIMFRVMDTTAHTLKTAAVEIENVHPLGRYVDLDVYDASGEALSRKDFGYGRRLCYLCGNPAHICVRTAAHKLEELLYKMEADYKNY